MDERDRDKFYTPSDPTPDDDEYELEPLDPAIVNAEKRHAKEVAEQVRASIDIDEVYRDAERNRGTEILENWARNFHYRFHIKHVLIATAVVVIGIALAQFSYFVPAITILVIGSIVGLYFYLNWHERQQQAEAYEKRQEMYAKRRERMLAKGGTPVDDEPLAPIELTAPTVSSSPNAATDMWDESPAPESVPIRFSLRSLMIAITVAAVILGMIYFLGGPGPTATILGLIAFVGLVIHAVGFEPPQSLILGWWFILLLYVLLTIVGAV
jgi:small-conductance mechanosensitive channel